MSIWDLNFTAVCQNFLLIISNQPGENRTNLKETGFDF